MTLWSLSLFALFAASHIDTSVQQKDLRVALADAQRRWEERRPSSYEFTIEVRCFCSGILKTPPRFRVTRGQPAAITELRAESEELYGSFDTKRGHNVRNFTDFFRETQLVRSDNRLDPDKLSTLERHRRYGNPNAGGTTPAFVTPSGVAKTVNDVQDAYIQKGDFVRLRELSATYTLPTNIAARMRADRAAITLAGQNLAVWTDYDGFDPEVVSNAGAAFQRDDFFTQPMPQRILLKLNLTF